MSWITQLVSLAAKTRSVRATVQKTRDTVTQVREAAQQAQAAAVLEDRSKAEQGDPDAQYEWAERYYAGLGVPRDYALAADWFRAAAEQGHAAAQSNLGILYFLGRGVPQDYCEAYKWIYLAAQLREPHALEALRTANRRLTPEQIAEGKRRAAGQ